MNLTFKYQTGHEQLPADTCNKLAALSDYLVWQHLTGDCTEHTVNLCFVTSDGDVTIVGDYNNDTETHPVQVWNDNVPLGSFNWHPHDRMGGLDMTAFKLEIKRFFKNI